MTTLARDEVFARYAVELTRYAASMVGPTDAQDVVSDALVRTMWSQNWHEIENQRAYLYRAVTSQARMNQRSASRRRAREARSSSPVPDPSLETSVDVWLALDHLTTMERAVVFLVYWEDLREVEVGNRLGVSERTVRRHLDRARGKLGRLLR